MSDAGSEEGEGVEFFRLHFLFRFFARASDIADEHDVAEVSFTFFGDRGEVEVEEAVFGIEDFEVAADGAAVGLHEGGPVDAANDFIEGLALGFVWGGSEEAATGVVDEVDAAAGVEEEDAFLEGFKDFLEEAFFSNEAREKRLYFLGLDLVESGKDFI